jgi:HD superfamily phosphohydrolase
MSCIEDDVEQYLRWLFKSHDFKTPRSGKIIHDSVWGTDYLSPHEVFILDTPLLQRLRKISQTGLAFFTFPSTTHTRFSHSLGVYSQVKKLIDAVEKGGEDNSVERRNTIQYAALLHDTGHGPFSHISEEIFKNFPEIKGIKEKKADLQNNPKAHEVLSYLIVKSDYFKNTVLKILSEKIKRGINIDTDLLGNCIVGNSKDKTRAYEIEFINGAFDADKLDYLMRDGLYSGLPLRIDLERLWYSVDLIQADFNYGGNIINSKRLTIKPNAESLMEQLVFAKMLLFMNFYHHQKIRASECLYKGIIEYIQDNNLGIKIKSLGEKTITFKAAVDFLYLDDHYFLDGFLSEQFNDPCLEKLNHNLQNRNHFVRAAVISYATIAPDYQKQDLIPDEIKMAFRQLLDLNNNKVYATLSETDTRKFAYRIFNEVKKKYPKCLKEEIWVDIPHCPSFDESEMTYVSPYTVDSEPIPFNKFFPSKMWAEQYRTHKYRINVFCPKEYIEETSKITKQVLKDDYGLVLNKLAFEICHQKEPA